MQIAQGSLVIIGANTKTPNVMWNGRQVEGFVDVKVNFSNKVTLKIKKEFLESDSVKAVVAAGISVKGV